MEIVGEGRSAQILAWDAGQVLKLYYDWMDRRSIEREFKATLVAYEAGVPVPHPYGIVEHEGRRGIIFERVNGISGVALFRRQPWRLPFLMRRIAQLQSETLNAHAPSLPDVREHLEATIRRVIQHDVLDKSQGGMILEHLKHLPAGDYLCHMDFHPDNVMQTATGWVIIDWMNANSGSVLADVARSSVIYQVSGPPPGTPGSLALSVGTRLANIFYRIEIHKLIKFTSPGLDEWILPVAAARLMENIPGERDKLIPLIDRLLKR